MKTLILCCGLLALPICAQTTTTPTPTATPSATPASQPQTLTDIFAKSSLRVLRAIEAETGKTGMSQDGGLTVPRATNQLVDDLDIDAQTKEEQAVVKMLQHFFVVRVSHNTEIDTLSIEAEERLKIALYDSMGPPSQNWRVIPVESPRTQHLGKLQPSDVVAKSPTVISIHTKEAACTDALEGMLRSRNYQVIDACNLDALSVPVPDRLDVDINSM